MKKIFKIFLLTSISISFSFQQSTAQQNHYIYIQADDKQQFNVSLSGKTYASSDIGYVIIPKLAEGKYRLTVTFPDNKYPDQQFECVINKSDEGYALKNYQEKGWGLFNLQTLDITMAGTSVADIPKDTTNPNAFGEMLSDVMSDTTLKTAGIELQAAEKSKEQAAQNAINNPGASVIVVPTLNDSLLSSQKQMVDSGKQANASIMKISETSTGAGTTMIFVDAGTHDTINIFLPKQQEIQTAQQETKTDSSIAINTVSDSTTTGKNIDTTSKNIVDTTAIAAPQAEASNQQAEIKNQNPLPDTTAANANPNNPFYKTEATDKSKSNTEEVNDTKQGTDAAPLIPSTTFKQDCKKMFSDNDLDKLKKKMISTSTDDKMIQTAKKYIEDKCVTTDQVKSLGALFLTDDARYSFYDAVYKNVYDVSTFPSLENQLIDPYYKKRFRAMLK